MYNNNYYYLSIFDSNYSVLPIANYNESDDCTGSLRSASTYLYWYDVRGRGEGDCIIWKTYGKTKENFERKKKKSSKTNRSNLSDVTRPTDPTLLHGNRDGGDGGGGGPVSSIGPISRLWYVPAMCAFTIDTVILSFSFCFPNVYGRQKLLKIQ